jgi:transcriptional regulator with XRE-family HTH domain
MIQNILDKIKIAREQKGLSHENMAYALNISQAAYSKLEKGITNLSVERLYQIAKVLETDIAVLMGIELKSEFNQTTRDQSTGYLQKIENFYQENKEQYQKIIELYEGRIRDKEALIESLKKQIG